MAGAALSFVVHSRVVSPHPTALAVVPDAAVFVAGVPRALGVEADVVADVAVAAWVPVAAVSVSHAVTKAVVAAMPIATIAIMIRRIIGTPSLRGVRRDAGSCGGLGSAAEVLRGHTTQLRQVTIRAGG
jgi:hypothetical protein